MPWHFHPEIEILFVVKSSGTSYVGDGIHRFTEGEISIIGENVPHWWKSDKKYFDLEISTGIKALIIQFNKEIFEENFINLPEMNPIKGFSEKDRREGFSFPVKAVKFLENRFLRYSGLDGIQTDNRINPFARYDGKCKGI